MAMLTPALAALSASEGVRAGCKQQVLFLHAKRAGNLARFRPS
jgi:hypothetical protein